MKILLLAALLAQTPSPVVDVSAIEDASVPHDVIVGDAIVIEHAPVALAPGDVALIKDTVTNLVAVVSNIKNASGLGIAAAVLAALFALLKLGVLRSFISKHNLSWVMPWATAIVGGLVTAVGAATAGTRDVGMLLSAFISGALAGFTASGMYDAARTLSALERSKKRVSLADIDTANVALASQVRAIAHAAVEASGPVTSAVDAAAAKPAKTQLSELAALLRSSKP